MCSVDAVSELLLEVSTYPPEELGQGESGGELTLAKERRAAVNTPTVAAICSSSGREDGGDDGGGELRVCDDALRNF